MHCARCLIFALLCLTTNSAFAECYPESAAAAERGAREARTWQALYDVYQRFRICDDGAVGKAYSASVSALLTTQWSSISDLSKLVARTPKFRVFVLRHIDSSMSSTQAQTIIRNADETCPRGQRSLCSAIAARVRSVAIR